MRSVLLVFTRLATVLSGGRRGARAHSARVRGWRAGEDALRRRSLRGPCGRCRNIDVLRRLCREARRLSRLSAGRRRVRNGPAAFPPAPD